MPQSFLALTGVDWPIVCVRYADWNNLDLPGSFRVPCGRLSMNAGSLTAVSYYHDPRLVQEDERLAHLVQVHGPKKWSLIASQLETKGSKQVLVL